MFRIRGGTGGEGEACRTRAAAAAVVRDSSSGASGCAPGLTAEGPLTGGDPSRPCMTSSEPGGGVGLAPARQRWSGARGGWRNRGRQPDGREGRPKHCKHRLAQADRGYAGHVRPVHVLHAVVPGQQLLGNTAAARAQR